MAGQTQKGRQTAGKTRQAPKRPLTKEEEIRRKVKARVAQKKRRRRQLRRIAAVASVFAVLFIGIMVTVIAVNRKEGGGVQHITLFAPENETKAQAADTPQLVGNRDYGVSLPASFQNPPAFTRSLRLTGDALLDAANRLAAMYDYDTAIDTLTQAAGYAENSAYQTAVASYEEARAGVVKWGDNTTIPHIFFHTLIVDPAKAFDVSLSNVTQVIAYNRAMTTVNEFVAILESMYSRGYVLVGLHDIAKMQAQADGSMRMTMQPIYLPEGKTPFVLSQDDVCYYEYMKGQGFPDRFVVGTDGKVTNEYTLDDGTVIRGSFDVMPILEEFIEAHPDFSYRGAKGTLAVTGYNGVWGYRTSDFWYNWDCDYFNTDLTQERSQKYYNNENITADKQSAKAVSEAIKAQGWTIASHSWGHIDVASSSLERVTWDADMWEREVKPLVGDTDIIIFAFGADLGTWRGYTADDPKFQHLKSKGFDYYCNVDGSKTYWVQVGADGSYFRQGRRNLDGQRMWQAMMSFSDENYRDRVQDLFDVREVFDPARPTPVQ